MTCRFSPRVFFILLLFSLFSLLASAAEPNAKASYFHHPPSRFFFFDDTPVGIYHDYRAGEIFISHDEGFSWSRVADIPSGTARMVIEHPFNNRYAFVLTAGKTHFRTDDRGKTWRPFEMPLPPSSTNQPLSFHSGYDRNLYILYLGAKCERSGQSAICFDETYYTKEAFSDTPILLLSETSRCQFAHSSRDFKHEAHTDLIYCVALDTKSASSHTPASLSSRRLFSSTDYFVEEKKVENLGIGEDMKGVIALAIVSKFAVVALKDVSPTSNGEVLLYVTADTKTWAKAQFPHDSNARLRENAYTVVESSLHSLAIDVLLHDRSSIGTLFMSNSNGTYFVPSLMDTNRNNDGYVDYENLYGVEGVGLAHVVANARDLESGTLERELKSMITFDDGHSWSFIQAPSTDINGERVHCDPAQLKDCSLHFHVTNPHNFGRIFSSPAPGLLMGVGSIGKQLAPYNDCDTFLSTDSGLTWKMVQEGAHKYEFGNQGSLLVAVDDNDIVDFVRYSMDFGANWKSFSFGLRLRAQALITLPDSTSQKFLLLGQIPRSESAPDGGFVVVQLDFSETRTRRCQDNDFEKWYARMSKGKDCLMGHKQWYKRRKPDADCYVGNKFADPVDREESCPCDEDDYECDYNYIRNGDVCVPAGPEPIPPNVCTGEPNQMYMGSSGYRKIPGNSCDRKKGLKKDAQVEKPCSQAEVPKGEVAHQTFEFPAEIAQYAYFKDSTTILVRLNDLTVWQSSNEGYTWQQLHPEERFLAFYHHSYSNDRAYLITDTKKYWYTTNQGKDWYPMDAPIKPNTFGIQILHFHPKSDYLIWTGNEGCDGSQENCHVKAYYSRDHGRNWDPIETYVRSCQWASDKELKIDDTQILCESYRDKTGSQRFFQNDNPLELVGGTNFFQKKKKLFDHVVGFAKFSEFLIVAEYVPSRGSLDLQVSLDGRNFATGEFPPSMHPETHAYTILESSTRAVFLHMTMTDTDGLPWGNLLKSNSNGTYFGVSLSHVNRDTRGYVDFEKMSGLNGIALVNVVSNPEDAVTGKKILQTRITHNDGGSWDRLSPPPVDSLNRRYSCDQAACALHVHGYTERYDARATYSSPSAVGLLMAVGNVGEHLAPYTESDTFISRDAGFTWEEVHKDAHLFEFGDSGSILVMANDEEPTDHVLYSTDEGLTWHEYEFSAQKMRIRAIVTVPSDTSRRFILIGKYARSKSSVVVHLDFSSLTHRKCVPNLDDPRHNDFEWWSPSKERSERCLFGRQTVYHRRVRNTNCVVGKQEKAGEKVIKNCLCSKVDFECEFNHVRNDEGSCVLQPGTVPLPNNDTCRHDEEYWYERTAYRKISFSTCEDGIRLDRGARHRCPELRGPEIRGPELRGQGVPFWWMILTIPFAITVIVVYWYYRRIGLARGVIRLPEDTDGPMASGADQIDGLPGVIRLPGD